MVLLENDLFLTELTRLFQRSRQSATGSVTLTMKKYDGHDRPTPKPAKPGKKKGAAAKKKKEIPKEIPKPKHGAHAVEPHITCLIRAKLHNRKISTVVPAKDVNRFQLAYCNLLKGNMDSLKKIKKTKSKVPKPMT